MTNVTISVDERLLDASRKYAKAHGISLNAFVRELLYKAVQPEGAQSLEHAFERADRLGKGSKGQKWTREELYDRKVFQP